MKTLLLTLFSLTITFGTFAQGNVVFQDAEQNKMPDTLRIVHDLNESELPFSFEVEGYVTNTTAEEQSITIRRIAISYLEGCADQVCWAMNCVPYDFEDEDVLSGEQVFEANEAFSLVDGSVFHYNHNENVGATTIKYILLNGNTAEDSVVVVYELTNNSGVGINKGLAEVNMSNPYPNPAVDFIKIDYELNNLQRGQVVLQNVIGKTVAVKNLNYSHGTVEFYISELPVGVYFISIKQNGVTITNKKLIKR